MNTSTKLMYGAGGFAMHASNFIIVTWLTKFYTPGPGKHLVAPAAFAAIVLLGRIVDAITDPVVGYWSDHHEGASGRRIPFIKWGSPFLMLFLILAFTPITSTQSTINAVYLAAVLAGFFFFYTVVITPYLSLIPELTTDPNERVNLTTIQGIFILIATIYVAALSGPIIDAIGYLAFILISGVLVFIASVLPLKAARPVPYKRDPQHEAGLKAIIRWTFSTMKNIPFRYVLISTSFFWFGLNLLMAGVALWVVNVLGGKDADIAVVMGPLILSNLIGFPIFNLIAKKKGKYFAFLLMFVGMVIVGPIWYFVERQPGNIPYLHAMVMSFLLGLPLAGFQALPYAILSDVIDHDEKLSGERREAIFFGMQAIVQKTMIGLSMVILQMMRVWFGEQMGLKLLGPVAALFSLIGLISFLGYPLREAHLTSSATVEPAQNND